ncbi:MAG: PTS sugar transporter subunit IIA [Pseudomonadales bacterium]|nr:PTS sugar transporter subunit IIA [Pseudomonadales bacterium]
MSAQLKIASILSPDNAYCALEAASKKRAIEEVATKLAGSIEGVNADDLFNKLINREKIGSTAIGHGIAIPHCRLDSIDRIIGGIFVLKQKVDFQAFDNEFVNILFVLLVPTEEVDEHLQVLAMLADKFESAIYRQSLINAHDNSALFQAATRLS